MLYACVRKLDVMDTAQTFLGTKRSLSVTSELGVTVLLILITFFYASKISTKSMNG